MRTWQGVLLSVLFAVTGQEVSFAIEDVIYISESGRAGDARALRSLTVLTRFKPDSTELGKVEVPGLMATVTHDGKRIAYLCYAKEGALTLVITDSTGQKVEITRTLLDARLRWACDPLDLLWSPDGEKIAFSYTSFSPRRPPNLAVFLYVIFPGRGETKCGQVIESEETHFMVAPYSARWFSDSRRILVAAGGVTGIVDTNTKRWTELSTNSYMAHLTEDESQVVYVTGDYGPATNKGTELWGYEVKDGRSRKIMSLVSYPSFCVLSNDGKSFLSPDLPAESFLYPELPEEREHRFLVVDLDAEKANLVNLQGLQLIPVCFRPKDNDLLLAVRMREEGFDYGVYSLRSGRFRRIKTINVPGDPTLFRMSLRGSQWR